MIKTATPEDHLTGSQEEWEEAVFRSANHFSVFVIGRIGKGEAKAYSTFPEAREAALEEPRSLLYAVTLSGRSFCIPRAQWSNYLRIWTDDQEG